MADGKIEIDTRINSKNLEKDSKNILSKLSNLGGKIKNVAGSLPGIGLAVAGVTAAISKTNEAIQESINLYRTQVKAETMLEAAAKNNPYLSKANVQALKDYASELQGIGTIGDEALMPLMAQLANAGRTQEEIQNIMKTSLDISASGAMSMESAVDSLNKTFSGTAGLLSRTIPELSHLTEEELKQGKGVEILSKKYEGMAENVTKATGSSEQLANTWGDFKELIGKPFSDASMVMENFFNRLISKVNDTLGRTQKLNESLQRIGNLNYNETEHTLDDNEQRVLDLTLLIEEQEKEIEKAQKNYEKAEKKLSDEMKKKNITNLSELNELNRDYFRQYENAIQVALQKLNEVRAKQEELEDKKSTAVNYVDMQKKENERARLDEERKARLKAEIDERDKLRAEYDETIRKAKEEIEQRRKLGIDISEETEAQQLLNIATEAYLKMVTSKAFQGNSLNYSHEVEARKYISELQNLLNPITENFDEKSNEWIENLHESLKSELDKMKDDLDEFDKQFKEVFEYTDFSAIEEGEQKKLQIQKDYAEKRKKLIDELNKYEKEKTYENIQKILSNVSEGINNLANTMSILSDMWTEKAKNEATVATAELEKQFSAGEVSEKEYYEKKDKIEKEAAEKSYKMQMWAWSAQLLQIGASTAQAIVTALGTAPTPVGIALAATVGVLGAAQLATAIANKPIPPSFAGGGFVGGFRGASMGQDNTYAHVRTGEAIFNAKQQRELWNLANGRGGASSSGNVSIKNYRGNDTKVSAQFSEDGLKVFVRKIVQEDLANGNMNNSLMKAENSFDGNMYI